MHVQNQNDYKPIIGVREEKITKNIQKENKKKTPNKIECSFDFQKWIFTVYSQYYYIFAQSESVCFGEKKRLLYYFYGAIW